MFITIVDLTYKDSILKAGTHDRIFNFDEDIIIQYDNLQTIGAIDESANIDTALNLGTLLCSLITLIYSIYKNNSQTPDFHALTGLLNEALLEKGISEFTVKKLVKINNPRGDLYGYFNVETRFGARKVFVLKNKKLLVISPTAIDIGKMY